MRVLAALEYTHPAALQLHPMSAQLSIRLPDELHQALLDASRRSGRKNAEIVREALREHLHFHPGSHRPASSRVSHLIGSLDSGIPDLAERHREYLIAKFTDG